MLKRMILHQNREKELQACISNAVIVEIDTTDMGYFQSTKAQDAIVIESTVKREQLSLLYITHPKCIQTVMEHHIFDTSRAIFKKPVVSTFQNPPKANTIKPAPSDCSS